MSPFRLVVVAGCLMTLLGAGYMSYYGVGRESSLAATGLAAGTVSQSVRTGSSRGGGYGVFGRIK